MFRRSVLPALVLAAAVPLLALESVGEREVRGRVISPEGKAVAGAVVLHRASGTKAMTGADGSFSLRLETANRVSLEIIHPDYHEELIDVPPGGGDGPLTVTLAPYIQQREEVVVTALRYPEPSLNVPAATSVRSGEALSEGLASNLTDGVGSLPGVSALGSGGFSVVPVIRGLSRNRVLFLVDSARVTSDRRTGPGASFVFPEDMDRVEVLRSPSSVFYGSDAVGGVFQVFLKEPDPRPGIHGRAQARYGTVNGEKGAGLSLSGRNKALGFHMSLQGVNAGDYRNSGGVVPLSHYAQWSLAAKLTHESEKRRVALSFLGSRGLNIGKPALDSATRPTWYPREHQNLAQIHWRETGFAGGELAFTAFVNPNFLETRTDRIADLKTRESYSRTESTDFGMQLAFNRRAAGFLRVQAGLDIGGRAGASAVNRDTHFDSQGRPSSTQEEIPYRLGSKRDFGLFFCLDFFPAGRWDVVGGVRLDRLQVEAEPGAAGRVEGGTDTPLSGFVAASYRLSELLVAFINLSRAYRSPTLSERFYTGITGRGFIVSRPDLEPERSVHLDGGLKVVTTRLFAAVYGFGYDIRGLIERYPVSDKIYTYGNVDRGRIRGGEAEVEWFPLTGLKLFGHVSLARGRSVETGQPLNDIPPLRFQAGARVWAGRFSAEAVLRRQSAKKDPGPSEIPIPAATLVDVRVFAYLPSSFQFSLIISNVLDAHALGRPDPDAPLDPGRNIQAGLAYSF